VLSRIGIWMKGKFGASLRLHGTEEYFRYCLVLESYDN